MTITEFLSHTVDLAAPIAGAYFTAKAAYKYPKPSSEESDKSDKSSSSGESSLIKYALLIVAIVLLLPVIKRAIH